MLHGYQRVSKDDGSQSLALQTDALLAAGVAPERLYSDRASGKREDRPGLTYCLKALQPGDVLMTWKIDRLGRDTRHLLEILHFLTQHQMQLRILTGLGAELDLTTVTGRMLYQLFSILAEHERGILIERTKAGLAAAKRRGKLPGRKRQMKPATIRMMMSVLQSGSMSVTELAEQVGVHRSTVYDYVQPDGTPTALGQALLGGPRAGQDAAAD
jgi:DNA invertase Pin-like site-specific DNA recombinase